MRIRVRIPAKKRIFLCVFAAVLVASFLFLPFGKTKETLEYPIVILGDSIVGNIGEDGKSFTHYLEEQLGERVLKAGFGGTCMSVPANNKWGSMSSVEWSMVKLAEAICYDDWKSQKATMAYAESYSDINNQALDYFAETMEQLRMVDFSKVDILIIEHGTNDYNAGKQLDNKDDLYDVTTFGGALRYSLKLLKERYPKLRIVLLSPTYCALGENQANKCYNTRYGEGGYLDEYVALEKEIAREFEVEWLDAYHDLGIWEENAAEYLSDFLHLNAKGHRLMGDFVADYLKKNH